MGNPETKGADITMRMLFKKLIYFFVSLIILLIISQLTRFENLVIVTYDGHTLLAKTHDTVVGAEVDDAHFHNLTAYFQKSASGESGFGNLEIYDWNGNLTYSTRTPILYLFGRDIFGTVKKGEYTYFRQTFGDWDQDQFRSPVIVIHNETLPSRFSMNIYLVGRGKKSISIWGEPTSFYIDIVDGLLGHDIYLCGYGTGKCHGTPTAEPISTNLKRIINFFVEALIGALLVIILVLVVFNKND